MLKEADQATKVNRLTYSREYGAEPHREQDDPRASLEKVAKLYGLKAEELDAAIRNWGAKATDPYEIGLAALFERNYPRATGQLQEALRAREEKLANDQSAAADAAFFLGFSLASEGKYSESIRAYQRCLQLRPSDTTAMANLAVILIHENDYVSADTLLRRALAIDEIVSGPDSWLVANDTNTLGESCSLKNSTMRQGPCLSDHWTIGRRHNSKLP